MAAANPVSEMSDREMINAAKNILDTFDDYAQSDPFGWDWPTMNGVFPDLCARYRELREEANRRVAAGTWTLEV